MPVTFHIRPELGLVHVRFAGHITVQAALSSLQDYGGHPDFRPNLNNLIDLSAVTDYERDFGRILAFMARMPEVLPPSGPEFLVVYYAPTAVARELARIVMRSWEGSPGPILRLVADKAQALEILGLDATRMADLLA